MLCMDLNQLLSLLQLGICAIRLQRQIEHKFTCFALEITCLLFQKLWQQLWQEIWDPCARVEVHGLHVFTEDCWMVGASTDQTGCAEHLAHTEIVPEISKVSEFKLCQDGVNDCMALYA